MKLQTCSTLTAPVKRKVSVQIDLENTEKRPIFGLAASSNDNRKAYTGCFRVGRVATSRVAVFPPHAHLSLNTGNIHKTK